MVTSGLIKLDADSFRELSVVTTLSDSAPFGFWHHVSVTPLSLHSVNPSLVKAFSNSSELPANFWARTHTVMKVE